MTEYNKEKRKEEYEKYKHISKETQKKYYEKNKEKYQEYQKEYLEANKEKIQEHYKKNWCVKVTCECGCSTRKDNITRHKQSSKHIYNMKEIAKTLEQINI